MYGGWRSWFEEDEHLLRQLLLRAEVFVSDRLNRDPQDVELGKLQSAIMEASTSSTMEEMAMSLYRFDRYRATSGWRENWQEDQIKSQLEAERAALGRYARQCKKEHRFLVSLATALLTTA